MEDYPDNFLSLSDVPYPSQSVGVIEAASRTRVMLGGLPMPSQHSYARNFELGHGAGDSSPTLREGHCGVFNVHQVIPADGTPV